MIDPHAKTAPSAVATTTARGAARLLRLALTPPSSLEVGQRFSDYLVISKLGKGGTGSVYRARCAKLKRDVALKILDAEVHAPDWLRREGEHQARVEHENIVKVYGFGEHRGIPYLVMELVGGEPLRPPAKSPKQAVEIMMQIAETMQFAHQRQIVHCDLKPANVLIEHRDGQMKVRITDFGHALRLDLEGPDKPVGTALYQAPEVWEVTSAYPVPEVVQQRPLSVLIDVWSMGVMLYEMLAGRPPFDGATMEELKRRVLEDPPPPLAGVDPDLEAVCLRCLEKDPARRYASAAHLAEDLQAFLDGREVRARPLGRAARWIRRIRRDPRPALTVGAVLLALTLGGATLVHVKVAEADRVVSNEGFWQRKATDGAHKVSARFQALGKMVEHHAGRQAIKTVLLEQSEVTGEHEESVPPGKATDVKKYRVKAPEAARQACVELDENTPEDAKIANWYLFDAKGTLLGRARPGVSGNVHNVGKRYDWRDYFRGAKDLRVPYVSRVYDSEAWQGEADIGIALAVWEGKKLLGVLVAEIKISSALPKDLAKELSAPVSLLALSDCGERPDDPQKLTQAKPCEKSYLNPVIILGDDLPSAKARDAFLERLGKTGTPTYPAPVADTHVTLQLHHERRTN